MKLLASLAFLSYLIVSLVNASDESETELIKRSPSNLLSKVGKKLKRGKDKFTDSFSTDSSEFHPSYGQLEYDYFSSFGGSSATPSEWTETASQRGEIDDVVKKLDELSIPQIPRRQHVNSDKIRWMNMNMVLDDPWRKRYFPVPRFTGDEAVIESRKEDMDLENRLILFSRLLRDLQKIPLIETELIEWEQDLTTQLNFWGPLREVGVISWIGKPSSTKLSHLIGKAEESQTLTKWGYKKFSVDVLSGHYMQWYKLDTPEYAYLQDYFNDILDVALTMQKRGASPIQMKQYLEIPYNVLHCLQLTFRNLAAEYYQMVTIWNNRKAGREDYYLPESNWGYTRFED